MPENLTEELNALLYVPGKQMAPNIVIPLYTISTFGVPANILSFSILSRPEMKASVNCDLQFLAVYDGLLLLLWFFFLNGLGHPYIHILLCTSALGSIYTTAGVSVERYIAVCYPLQARTLLSYRRTVLCNLFVGTFTVCMNIPRLFLPEELSNGNIDFIMYYCKRFGPEVSPQFLVTFSSDVAKFLVWAEMIILLVALIVIASLNICIWKVLQKATATRQELRRTRQKERNLSKTILAVVITFFSCWTPWLIFKVMCYWGVVPRSFFYTAYVCGYSLLALNSAANVIIYSVLRPDFRKIIVDAFCNRKMLRNKSSAVATIMSSRAAKSNINRGN